MIILFFLDNQWKVIGLERVIVCVWIDTGLSLSRWKLRFILLWRVQTYMAPKENSYIMSLKLLLVFESIVLVTSWGKKKKHYY